MNRKQISSRMRKIEEEYPVLLHNPKGFAVPVTVTVVLIISAVVFSFWFTFLLLLTIEFLSLTLIGIIRTEVKIRPIIF